MSDSQEQTPPEFELDSIVKSIRKKLGGGDDYTYFNHDLITEINTALATLYQIGVGDKIYKVYSEDDSWDDFADESNIRETSLEFVKEYVYLSVKLMFDPPESSFYTEALKNKKDEMEWRLYLDEDILE